MNYETFSNAIARSLTTQDLQEIERATNDPFFNLVIASEKGLAKLVKETDAEFAEESSLLAVAGIPIRIREWMPDNVVALAKNGKVVAIVNLGFEPTPMEVTK